MYQLNFTDNNGDLIIQAMNSEMTNVTMGYEDYKVTTSNGFDWLSPVNRNMNKHWARLDVINDVLLPLPSWAKSSLQGEPPPLCVSWL